MENLEAAGRYRGLCQDETTPNPVDAFALAEVMEDWLGDPELESNTVCFVRSLELDERDELPSAGIERVRGFGLHRYLVPVRLGGELRTAEQLLMLTRVVARRDMNVMISESTQLWMMLVWIAGDADQQASSAATVLRGQAVPCLGYSEASHGADLAANDFLATPDGEQYVLSGEKFPINRGRTSTHVVLLGATGGQDTPARRKQSLFLVDRSRLLSGKVSGIPRVPTYGLRGCDISGVAFDNVRVDSSALLGAEGEGLELALRGLLITRTFCTGLSLGAGDTMLRAAAAFLSRRRLYGGTASEIPCVSESLANAYLSLLVAECESLVAMRGLHLFTEELSLWANLAKVQVARLVDVNSKVLAQTLGARYYMRASEHVGIFQKMLRDSAVVSVFDGSEPVCLDSIALQLPAITKARRQARDEDWSFLYDLRKELPEFEPARVSVFGRGRDATFASLSALVCMLDEMGASGGCDAERVAALRVLAAKMVREADALCERADQVRQSAGAPSVRPSASGKATSPHLVRLAEDACSLHAKVAVLGMWLHNREHLDGFFADGEWLEAVLSRERVHQYEVGDLKPSAASRFFARMGEQLARHEFFSIQTVRQAGLGAREADPVHRTQTRR
jgi:alkylation response protein AidB-like acyl-CoA dehydrogenase